MDEFEKELKIGFLQEGQQLLADTEQCFLELESDPGNANLMDKIFRLAHNLKGSSKAVGFDDVGVFTHEFESLLLKLKNGEIPKNTKVLNLLLRCNDHLKIMVDSLMENLEAKIDSGSLIDEIKQAQAGLCLDEETSGDSSTQETTDAESFFEAQAASPTSSEEIPSETKFEAEPNSTASETSSLETKSEEALPETFCDNLPSPDLFKEEACPVESTLAIQNVEDLEKQILNLASTSVEESLTKETQENINKVKELNALADEINASIAQMSGTAGVDSHLTEKTIEQLLEAHANETKTETPKVEEKKVSAPEVVPPVNTAASTVSPVAPVAAVASTPQVLPKEVKTNEDAQKKNAATPDDSIRVSLSRLEKLINIVGELVILQSVLREQALHDQTQLIRKTSHQIGKVTKEVQEISMSLRMIPVKQTFQKMQRIVRDTAQLLGKKITLHLSGEETELDKTVLEYLSDPLVHIIRNAADHGIENSEKRKAAGKPENGNVYLSAYHQAGKLVIEIKDDGGGIPAKVLYEKAIEKGILKAGAPFNEKECVNLIFHPGFSTKSVVTEVSGRGVGMDVVKTNIERLSGEIDIQTELGKGTVFKIALPLTLAIIDGMVVRCGTERFVIPLNHVHETIQTTAEHIQFASGLGEVLLLRGENLILYRLNKILNQKTDQIHKNGIAIIVRSTGRPFAVFVDDIIGQNQIVIKKLGEELSHVKGFSGSAILGDGRPSLILELPDLIQLIPQPTKPMTKMEKSA